MQTPIVHQPFQIALGPLTLTGFGIAVALSFVIASIISKRELIRRGHLNDAGRIDDLIMVAILGMIVGGKLYYSLVITHDWHDIFSRAGFVFWGGLMGGMALGWLYVRVKKLSFMRFADMAGMAIAAGYSVGRTGCWAVGDDYGRPWNGPLAVQFPNGAPPSTAGIMQTMFGTPIPPGATPETVLSVHPTQLYETALGFVMFAILWRMRDHKHAEGWLLGVYMALAGIERFIIEFFRAKDDRFFGPLTAAQVIGITIAVLGVVLMQARKDIGPSRAGIYAT
jgi:phosphatidylglycerol---prolipoprotein diacylglyceryl transferase